MKRKKKNGEDIPHELINDPNDIFESNSHNYAHYNDHETEEEKVVPYEFFMLVEQEKKLIEPHLEGTDLINMGDDEDLLVEFSDMFTWLYQDMPGLDTNIMEQRLPLKSDCKPVYQKLRRMKLEMLLKIKEEVKKQFDAGKV
ncbi:hypothetical protein Goklo_013865 [Gossypium klotzschianum]|uniref:Uncharacterized protein n=1 Tax=Gossypium klotzschianum TaxID=34286 RepID=A0A7J8U5P3_9ROSI|nr:hypothetical protein [Gossypium klotzschianum]